MKTHSRFACLKEHSKKKHGGKTTDPVPAPVPVPVPARVPAPVPAPVPVPVPVQEHTISWKDHIHSNKETTDSCKPIRGSLLMWMDKKTKRINRIEHPSDIIEQKISDEQSEENRLQQCYLDYRNRAIEYFIYDLEMGHRHDFNSVEEYIDYLDNIGEDSEEDDIGDDDDEENYDSQDEYGSHEEY